MGDRELAEQAFNEVRKLRPDFTLPPLDHNILLVSETGTSPRKVADGLGHSELKFRRGKDIRENRAEFIVNGESYNAYPMEDIFFQANSRGGRPVDKILEGKAVFRTNASDIGLSLTSAAEYLMLGAPLLGDSMGALQAVSGGLAVLGSVTTYAAIRSRPHADVRFWRNLPDTIHILTLASPAKAEIAVQYFDTKGEPFSTKNTFPSMYRVREHDSLSWTRSRPALSTSGKWHNIMYTD